jgi:hypothetical protein
MRLGIVSDTHGHVPFTREAVRMLDAMEVEEVIHCGDIGSAEIVPLFSAWPAHFVFGNVDVERDELREAIAAAGQTCHDCFGTLERLGRKIAFLHSDDQRCFEAAVREGRFDLVCYGHTHKSRQQRVGKTLVLNPGAVFRASPRSIAVVELLSLEVTIVPVS